MEHAERLADHLAGELDADEQAALQAELARDPALRAQLRALQRADASLAGLASPAAPEGFEARLDARLDAELASLLGPAETPAPEHDELASRRARRQPPRWVIATSSAAAALVLVAGGGFVLSRFTPQGTEDSAGDETTMQTLDGSDMADEDEPESSAETFTADGPTVVASGRDLDDDAVTTLVDQAAPLGLAQADLTPDAAAQLRERYLDAFGVAGSTRQGEAPEAEADADDRDQGEGDDAGDEATEQSDDDAAAGSDPPTNRRLLDTTDEVTDEDLADVTRCLGVLLEDSADTVPVYAELASRDGEPVVAFGLVAEEPETGTFSRREVWVLSRDNCEVRFFAQR